MKKLFTIVAIALVTSAAQAQEQELTWRFDSRSCMAYPEGELLKPGVLTLDDVLKLQKMIPFMKRCAAWHKCLGDRMEGKVKHCYYNDRRWREGYKELIIGPIE